jgi:hypothetical protein
MIMIAEKGTLAVVTFVGTILIFSPLYNFEPHDEGPSSVAQSNFFRESLVANFVFIFPIILDSTTELFSYFHDYTKNLVSDSTTNRYRKPSDSGYRMSLIERFMFLIGAIADSMVLCATNPTMSNSNREATRQYILYICAARFTSIFLMVPMMSFVLRYLRDLRRHVAPIAVLMTLGAILSSISYFSPANSSAFVILQSIALALVVLSCGTSLLYLFWLLLRQTWHRSRSTKNIASQDSASSRVLASLRQKASTIQPIFRHSNHLNNESTVHNNNNNNISNNIGGNSHANNFKSHKSSVRASFSFDEENRPPGAMGDFYIFAAYLGLLGAVSVLNICWYTWTPQDGYSAGLFQYVVIAIVHVLQMVEARVKSHDVKLATVSHIYYIAVSVQ